jgi:hypothetical protein
VLDVVELVTRLDVLGEASLPVLALHVHRRRDRQAGIEEQRRVETFVGGVLAVEREADPAAVRVSVPA